VGEWTTNEDITLKDAVEKHNGKDWAAISAFVPGRTKQQCLNRWHGKSCSKTDESTAPMHSALDSNRDEATARVGRLTKEEDSTLKDAVEKHNGENWAAISALVPGRTKKQCMS
jgi:hypothetical protein